MFELHYRPIVLFVIKENSPGLTVQRERIKAMKNAVLKKIVCGIVVITMIVTCIPVYVSAQDNDNNVNKDWEGYTPISTKEELDAIRNDPYGMYYLTNDIEFGWADYNDKFNNGGKFWNPIGEGYVKVPTPVTSTNQFKDAVNKYGTLYVRVGEYKEEYYSSDFVYYEPVTNYVAGKSYFYMKGFYGIFDGNGHSIRYVPISRYNEEHAGLFGVNFGTITNLTVTQPSIDTSSYAGGICGENYGIITNCRVASIAVGDINATYFVGGICGMNYGYISDCEVDDCRIDTREAYAGGIAGVNSGTVRNCTYTGIITGAVGVGGICGATSYSTMVDCFANVEDIDGAEGSIGYLVGLDLSEGTGENYYSNCVYVERYSCTAAGNLSDDELHGGQTPVIPVDSQEINKRVLSKYLDYENVWYGGAEPHLINCADTEFFDVSAVWDGSVAKGFAGGSGTYEDPYVVSNAAQLAYLSDSVYAGNTYKGKYIELSCDIILNDVTVDAWFKTATQWYSIGGESHPFEGHFNGNGYTVSGLYYGGTYYSQAGLFGYIGEGAVVENVDCQCYITAFSDSAAICGYNAGGTIKGCSAGGYIDGYNAVGFIGGVNEGTVTGCSSKGIVRGGEFIGGICGYNFKDITECKNEANVISYSYECGGICSVNEGTVSDCYNTGNVDANAITGGIASENFGVLTRCYNVGYIYGGSYVGSICGYNEGSGIKNCYYLEGTATDSLKAVQGGIGSSVSGSASSDITGVTGKLTEDKMREASNYEGFDFKSVWIKATGKEYNYPELRSQLPAPNGDVNGDGEINSKDSNMMKRYIAGEAVIIDEYNADLNSDGELNAKDSNLLKIIITGTI